MSKAIIVVDAPTTCSDCFFCGDIQELSVGNGLYKKIARCLLEEYKSDPWRDMQWMLHHKEDNCPLKTVPEKKLIWHEDERSDWERGYNVCLSEILGGDES